jgi:type IX secretion system PorP/SprF family membrane protein
MSTSIKYEIIKPGNKHQCVISLVIVLAFFMVMDLQAQDIHFSQFFAAPLLINPANTGMSGEDFRIANIYRNQWSNIGIPYETFSTSIDKKLIISGHSIGVGGLILHDQSSSFNLSANEFMLAASYSQIIRNQQLTIGLQPGFVFKSIDLAGITFNSQFNPTGQIFDQTLPSLESSIGDRMRYFDLNAGIFWRTMIRTIMPSAGISVSHLNMPVQKFLTSSTGTRLQMRFNFDGEVMIPVITGIDLNPCLIFSFTPGANEFLLGSTGDFSVSWSNIPIEKLHTVTMFRLNPVRDIDAFILGGGAEFRQFNLGLAYDLNISPLHKATNFNGAFEVSLIYKGNKSTRNNASQPCYMIN